ncbi:hypothetical protein HCN44_010577 [Aphidius gifuensis]|uniref:Extracellular superoxide dismutase [Cu-Zn] n=1 Tax=Aphidius gifuensis TaxID=684658 RepID=A0A834XT81_APHGI|nr:hypothetical protein HCN44_010577 [Aphidius gifuensis]
MNAKVEFAVQMTCQSCVDSIEKSLSSLNGVDKIDVSLERGTVVVQSSLPYTLIQEKIEDSGRRAVFKGYGENSISAVSMINGDTRLLKNNNIQGVVRFVQANENCIIDGTIDGLTPGKHGLHVHECGDISKGCESVGDHFNPYNSPHGAPENDANHRHVGDLGNVEADNSGRARFRLQDKLIKVGDIIGRSLVITQNQDDLGNEANELSKIHGNSGDRIACGIIARSSGIFENTKKICACSGKTLWDERDETKKKGLLLNVTKLTPTLCEIF